MANPTATRIIDAVGHWFSKKVDPKRSYLCDFKKICDNVKPADVLLIEGRSRVSRIIKQVTYSPWSHASLYIGKLNELKDEKLFVHVKKFYSGPTDIPLLIESEIGKGTILIPLSHYKDEHIRISRPSSLTPEDATKVIAFAINRLGHTYSIRHLLDLARFLFPWGIFPRRWRSSLFSHNALKPTEEICSYMIASAFMSVNYPILPLIEYDHAIGYELTRRNPKLFTPSDFDYSPYFNIIKYPIFNTKGKIPYKNLPWKEGEVHHD